MTTETEFLNFVKHFQAHKILDVATGHGGFIPALQQWFPNAKSFTGIDAMPKAIEHAKLENGNLPKTEFSVMDAHHLTFDDESFDVVSISNSIHHLDAPEKALQEMVRVLKKGGLLLVYEMVNDGQTETQMTHVLFHHWWAKIDKLLGVSHYPTYSRVELRKLNDASGIHFTGSFEETGNDTDPMDATGHERFKTNYQNYLTRMKDLPESTSLAEEGVVLLNRLNTIGVHPATELFLIGTK